MPVAPTAGTVVVRPCTVPRLVATARILCRGPVCQAAGKPVGGAYIPGVVVGIDVVPERFCRGTPWGALGQGKPCPYKNAPTGPSGACRRGEWHSPQGGRRPPLHRARERKERRLLLPHSQAAALTKWNDGEEMGAERTRQGVAPCRATRREAGRQPLGLSACLMSRAVRRPRLRFCLGRNWSGLGEIGRDFSHQRQDQAGRRRVGIRRPLESQ